MLPIRPSFTVKAALVLLFLLNTTCSSERLAALLRRSMIYAHPLIMPSRARLSFARIGLTITPSRKEPENNTSAPSATSNSGRHSRVGIVPLRAAHRKLDPLRSGFYKFQDRKRRRGAERRPLRLSGPNIADLRWSNKEAARSVSPRSAVEAQRSQRSATIKHNKSEAPRNEVQRQHAGYRL